MTQTWWQVDGIGDAGRVSAPATPTARSQLGYVRLWPPRAVDVTLTWGPVAKVHGNGKPGKSGDESAVAPDEEADALARRLALTLQTPPELWLNQADSEDWPHELYPFQKTGIRALLETPHFLLADEMGLGKSVQTAAALRILFHRREIERALVVVPSSLLEQWRRELRKWVPEIVVLSLGGPARERRWQWRYQAHITLVSYEILR